MTVVKKQWHKKESIFRKKQRGQVVIPDRLKLRVKNEILTLVIG
jgi:hypothetical protein